MPIHILYRKIIQDVMIGFTWIGTGVGVRLLDLWSSFHLEPIAKMDIIKILTKFQGLQGMIKYFVSYLKRDNIHCIYNKIYLYAYF